MWSTKLKLLQSYLWYSNCTSSEYLVLLTSAIIFHTNLMEPIEKICRQILQKKENYSNISNKPMCPLFFPWSINHLMFLRPTDHHLSYQFVWFFCLSIFFCTKVLFSRLNPNQWTQDVKCHFFWWWESIYDKQVGRSLA